MLAMAGMMAAMMLPAGVPAALRRARTSVRTALLFLVSYLAAWALIGAATHVLYRPPGVFVAGLITIAAGLYELTPLKRHACLGLMAVQIVLGMTDVTWMVLIATIVVAQQVLPQMRAVDLLLGLAIIALGLLIVLTPNAIPAITQPIFLAAAHICG
jgi:predicted metal-binding membrane protein